MLDEIRLVEEIAVETIVVDFKNEETGLTEEIEIPLSITANDLIYALNNAYTLGISSENILEYYLCSENPIAFLRGEKMLSDFGLRDGSVIIFKR